MNPSATDHSYLDGIGPDRLAALVFELASQLHVERQRRVALEAALTRGGVLAPGALDAMAADPDCLAASRAALDQGLRRLMRVVLEAGDPQGPLRAEAVR